MIVIAATNRPDVLDAALLRPGRFDRRVAVQPPDRAGREAILEVHARGVPLAPDVDLGRIAATTPGMVGADLANLVNEAALLAARRNHDAVEESDFTDALERIVLGAERQVMMSEEDRRLTAYHEGGHAIVGHAHRRAPTRCARSRSSRAGMALGVTFAAPESDRFNYREPEVHAKIKVALGGRAAEEVVFGEISTGAESDIQQLTEIARQMVGRWGMSPAIGPVAVIPRDGAGPLLPGAAEVSPTRSSVVDEEVRRIVDESHEQVVALLQRASQQARLARGRAARARDARRGGRLRRRGRPPGRDARRRPCSPQPPGRRPTRERPREAAPAGTRPTGAWVAHAPASEGSAGWEGWATGSGDEHPVDHVDDAVRGGDVGGRDGCAADHDLAALDRDRHRLAVQRLRRIQLDDLVQVTSPLTTW